MSDLVPVLDSLTESYPELAVALEDLGDTVEHCVNLSSIVQRIEITTLYSALQYSEINNNTVL